MQHRNILVIIMTTFQSVFLDGVPGAERIPLNGASLRGPFSVAQLVAHIGMHNVYGLAARHAIVFADKDRYTYYAPFTLDDIDESMPAWA